MLSGMFTVSEAEAAAIRAAYLRGGELAAAVKLRRRFPGIDNTARARECARIIAGWKPLPKLPRVRRSAAEERRWVVVSFREMVSNAPGSPTKRAAGLRQLAGLAQDEDVRRLLTDLADECDVLANVRPPPSPEAERRRPGRVEYQNPELIPLLRGQLRAAEKDRNARRSDRRFMLLCSSLWPYGSSDPAICKTQPDHVKTHLRPILTSPDATLHR
jgi:hypothetical protein